MKIILFLALSLILESLCQPDLSALDSSTCGLLRVPDVIPNEWIDPEELVLPNPLPQVEESARIYQGFEVNTRIMPWVVYIYSQRENFPIFRGDCTGSIISREWVFTAGHCMFYRNHATHQYEWYGQMDHTIRAGPRNYIPTGFYFNIRSRNWFIRNDYRQHVADANRFNTTPGIPNDIALIRLYGYMNPVYEPNTRSFLVNSICLPRRVPAPNPYLLYQVAGYGMLGLFENYQNLLMAYASQIQANYSVCLTRGNEHLLIWLRNTYGDHRFHMMDDYRNNQDDPRIVCTTPDETHRKPCPGDSGGPLFNERTQRDQMGNIRFELTGVVHGSIGLATLEGWISFLTEYRAKGGLPITENIVTLARRIHPFYTMHWPCGISSVFNVLNEYAPWIDQTIRTYSVVADATRAWLYYTLFFMVPLGGGYVYYLGFYRHQPEPAQHPPVLVAPPLQIGQSVLMLPVQPLQPIHPCPFDQPCPGVKDSDVVINIED